MYLGPRKSVALVRFDNESEEKNEMERRKKTRLIATKNFFLDSRFSVKN